MQKTNNLAKISMFLWPFGIIGPIVAFLALRQIKQSGEKGKRYAVISLILWALSMSALYLWAAIWKGDWLWFLG